MSGAINSVSGIKTANQERGNAFCLGRDAMIAGSGTNPFVVGSSYYAEWAAGYAMTSPQGQVDSCAACVPILVPNILGMTSAVAQAALIASNLAVGVITLTTGVVTIQNPATGTKAQRNQQVAFTLTS